MACSLRKSALTACIASRAPRLGAPGRTGSHIRRPLCGAGACAYASSVRASCARNLREVKLRRATSSSRTPTRSSPTAIASVAASRTVAWAASAASPAAAVTTAPARANDGVAGCLVASRKIVPAMLKAATPVTRSTAREARKPAQATGCDGSRTSCARVATGDVDVRRRRSIVSADQASRHTIGSNRNDIAQRSQMPFLACASLESGPQCGGNSRLAGHGIFRRWPCATPDSQRDALEKDGRGGRNEDDALHLVAHVERFEAG